MKFASAIRRRGNLQSRGNANSASVTVVEIDKAIQSLRRARKNQGVKYVIIGQGDSGVTITAARAPDILNGANSGVRQRQALNSKIKVDHAALKPVYRIEESGETLESLKDRLRSSSRANGDFFARLESGALKR